ncbi:MAG: SusC/RagA family TonB-linked outer membrane protein, partial [Bacteroidota bacterium]
NRLADINPNDIERIEVIKGAAAAAIYGSRASNGVVQIFTKRGKTGKPRFSFTTNTKLNELRKEIDYNQVPLAWVDPFDRANLETVPAQRFNLQDEIFESGFGIENFLSVSGGSEKTKYFVSGSYLNNEGIVKNTDFERYGLKVNLDQEVSDWLSFNTGINYVRSESSDIPNGGILATYGALTGYYFSDNSVDPSPDESGVFPATSLLVARTNPAEAVARFDFGQKTNRVITNLGIQADITDKLSANYVIGFDYANQSGSAFIPPGNTSPQATGFARRADANNFLFNNDLNLSYKTDINEAIESTTVLGGTWQYQESEIVSLESDRLPPLVRVASAGTIINQFDFRTQESFWGAFLQQSFGYKDKLYLNGAVRYDGASVFGEDERNQVYAKVSASYVISDESFWEQTFGSAFNTFKLRSSWGQAGNLTALSQLDRLSLFNPVAINGNSGLLPSTRLGNENVAPERQEEFEVGFDAGFLDNRLAIEFTYYNQQISDLLLERELSSSTGFSTRFENIGDLENKGIEILLRATPFKNKDFSWDITTTFSTNDNEVTNVPGERIGLAGSFATSFVIEGQPLGVFFRSFYNRDDNGNIILDGEGLPTAGTAEDGGNAIVIGDPNPEWFGSLINEFVYKNFKLRIQLDAVQGFDILNFNRRLADNGIFGGGPNVGQELLGNLPKGLGGRQAGIFEEFVEDGSFVKLREVGLSYTFYPKKSFINSLEFSLVGRNLISWDDYTGYDPEVNTPGQSNGVRGFDFASVPIPRTYQLGLNFSF